MADFKIAFERTEENEGKNIWTCTEGDSGGETWSGISRKANPNWAGWTIIDAVEDKVNGQTIASDELESLKQDLYKTNYWDKVWGDRILLQGIANDMYDTAVNMGVSRSVKMSEKIFGLTETGTMSEALLDCLNTVSNE